MTTRTEPPKDVRGLLRVLETYYDAAPRPNATTEEHGPFTVFLTAAEGGFPYYARPRLGLEGDVVAGEVAGVLARQRDLGVPEIIEWVHETTPSLLPAARSADMEVEECPLLVLRGEAAPGTSGQRVEMLREDSPDLAEVMAAIGRGFGGDGTASATQVEHRRGQIRAGLVAMAAAYDGSGRVVGGGSHGPRGATTELTGIAVLPHARRQGFGEAVTAALVADARERGIGTVFLSAQGEAVARIYERVGFVRVGTACVGVAAPATGGQLRMVERPDWEVWREIRYRSLRDTPDAYGSTYERESAFTEADWRERLEDPTGVSVLAYDDRSDQPGQPDQPRPVGMGGAFQDLSGWLHVVAMWTDPAWRGRGVGRAVLDHLVGWARDHDLRVHLDVTVGNDGARTAYERCGFVPTGETRPLRDGSPLRVERMILPA